jgi:hypothetical protein
VAGKIIYNAFAAEREIKMTKSSELYIKKSHTALQMP